jgi:hypothetical protein
MKRRDERFLIVLSFVPESCPTRGRSAHLPASEPLAGVLEDGRSVLQQLVFGDHGPVRLPTEVPTRRSGCRPTPAPAAWA